MTLRLTLPLLLLLAQPAAAQTLLRFPAVDPSGTLFSVNPIIHVDHDPVDSDVDVECTNYAGVGFPWCYDQHTGTDFLLVHGFATMDEHGVEVVAAADGAVIEAVDGNYDRCHGQGLDVSCDGHPMVANRVVLLHADGLVTQYYHLKNGSVNVTVGQQVSCGDVLGHVGSSGLSALPHLHFGVRDASGAVVDPDAGPNSQPDSLWTEQDGPLGRPGDRCQGDPLPADASTPDGALDGGSVVTDAGLRPDGPGASSAQPAGCAVAGGNAALPLATLFLALLALGRRRLRR